MAITKRAMKNLSRAYNRYMQHVKFVKRVKDWFAHEKNDVTEIKKALSGENYTFLRTTGRPCNCEGCTYLKYKRTPKHKVMKEAFKE
jgi:hypothetical protein